MDPLVILIVLAAFLGLALLAVLAGRVVGRYAESKGFPYRTWFWWGFFLPIPAFILLLLNPDAETRQRRVATRLEQRDRAGIPKRKRCPDCAETIQHEARVCKPCGYRFVEAPEGAES